MPKRQFGSPEQQVGSMILPLAIGLGLALGGALVPPVGLAPAHAQTAAGQAVNGRAVGDAEITPLEALYRVRRLTSLREAPDYGMPPAGDLAPDQQIKVTGKVEGRDWYRVETADGVKGFVMGALITPDDEADVITLATWRLPIDGSMLTLEPLPPLVARPIDPADLEDDTKHQIQEALVYLSLYPSIVDGQFGERTISAIQAFQGQRGESQNGRLTEPQYADLLATANQVRASFDLRQFVDGDDGYSFDYPAELLTEIETTGDGGWRLLDPAGNAELTVTQSPPGADLEAQFAKIEPVSSYTRLRNAMFVAAGSENDMQFYHIARQQEDDGRIVEAHLRYRSEDKDDWDLFTVVLLNSFQLEG
jgi:hypothetical protein